ncbi:MAG TPA: DUF3795 domain-containing protein [Mesotoga infera]|nr:DUF3795 domain-containing protein [Mesotoga infera]
MLAFCGIDCSNCPVYRATMTNDEILKRETAEKWGREFGFVLEKSEMTCTGCRSEILFKLCFDCPFKECCSKKGIDNCGQCAEYPCQTLERFLRPIPEARANLDEIHRKFYGGTL